MTTTDSTAARDPARGVQTGIALMITAMLYLPLIDLFAKALGPGGAALAERYDLGPPLPPLEIAWARLVIQAAIVAPLLLALVGWSGLWPKRPGFAAMRGVLIALATALFFTGLQFLKLAECIAIFFVEPLILTVLSALILREPIGWRRILAVLVGLAGALLIVQPRFIEVGWPALLPLGAALCFAFYLLLTKILAATENALTLHLWAGGAGGLLLTLALAVGALLEAPSLAPVAPSANQWLMLLCLGVIATSGHFLVVLAFRRAPASLLAPFQYLEIVSATLLGFFFFAEFPDPISWLGVAIIVGSGVFVAWRERRRETAAG